MDWLQRIGRAVYATNHQQIVTGDTIQCRLPADSKLRIYEDPLYDACVTKTVIQDQEQILQWTALMRLAFG